MEDMITSLSCLEDICSRRDEMTTHQLISTANQLLSQLSVNTFSDADHEKLFDDFFMQDKAHVFLILCHSIKKYHEVSYRRDKIIQLISCIIHKDLVLFNLLMSMCKLDMRDTTPTEREIMSEQLQTVIVSLPEMVANIIKLKTPKQFERIFYFDRIVTTIYTCLQNIHDLIIKETSCSLEFLSHLMGRICLNGYSELMWSQLIQPIVNQCENDFIWRRITNRVIIASQKEQYIESIIKPIIIHCSNHHHINYLIANCVETNLKVKFLMQNKFLLIHEFESDLPPKNIFGYLNETSSALFIEAFKNILNSWSNSSSLKYRSYSQHFYLSRCLMIAASKLKGNNSISSQDKYKLFKILIHGVEVHLFSSQVEVRNIGTTIAQYVSPLLLPDGGKGIFELEETNDVKHLIRLFNEEDEKIDRKEEQTLNLILDKKEKLNLVEDITKSKDNDDDLIPFDMSHDLAISKSKKPFYLRDCIAGLADSQNIDWLEVCLETAESIIRKNCNIVHEVAIEFTKLLLYLEDNVTINDFIGLRHRALIALCVCAPQLVARYLTHQFYAPNINVRQRLDILEVLACASRELSEPNNKLSSSDLSHGLTLEPQVIRIADEHWKNEVEKRIVAKSRMIAHKSKPIETFVNKFSPVSGDFFFPLMQKHDRHDIGYDLFQQDTYVLGRLLFTLGIMMKSASLSPNSKRMGLSLAEFIWTFRYHCDAFVRQALVFDLCMILTSVPHVCLINEMQTQLVEFQFWLKDITEKDTDDECIRRAGLALSIIKGIANEM